MLSGLCTTSSGLLLCERTPIQSGESLSHLDAHPTSLYSHTPLALSRLYPVLALGFNDLKKRVGSQHAEASRQRALLSQLSARLSALEQKHSLQNTVRASAAASRQSQLHHRLVSLVAKAGMLVPALRGRSIGPEEERLIAILESCDAEITRSAANDHAASASGHARLRAKVNELWAQVGVVRAKREVLAREGRASGTEWAVVDESGLENVSKVCLHVLQQRASPSLSAYPHT